MNPLIQSPYGYPFFRDLEIIPELFEPLLEELKIIELTFQTRSCKTHLPTKDCVLLVINDCLMLSNGGFSLSLSDIQSWNIQSENSQSPILIQIISNDSSLLEISVTSSQSSKVWDIIKTTDNEKPIEENEHLKESITCSCCRERAEFIRQYTAEHPVAIILSHLCNSKVDISFKIKSDSYFSDTTIQPLDYSFLEGIGEIKGVLNERFSINFTFIHGVRIHAETIDGEDYSTLVLYNSLGQNYLQFSIVGNDSIIQWNRILTSLRHYTPS